MMNSIKKIIKETDWVFLIFLLIFLNQSNFSFKTIGIIFIYIVRPDFRFGFLKGRMPKFYLVIIVFALINFLFVIRDFSFPYLVAFSLSCLLWFYSFLAYHQLKLSVEKNGEKNSSTLKVFTILNFIVCIIQLVQIMKVTGNINPYREQIAFPYGLSTGDNLFGIFLQNCYYNVMICSFLAVYFLYKRNFFYCLLSVTTIILVFANGLILIFLATLLLIFAVGIISGLFKKGALFKGLSGFIENIRPRGKFYIAIPIVIAYFFLVSYIVSPENLTYTRNSLVSKIHQGINKKDKTELYTAEKKDNAFYKNSGSKAIDTNKNYVSLLNEKETLSYKYIHEFKGKKLSMLETFYYLQSSPVAFLFGAGPVRFSSLTAQKMAGYDSSRIFMKILPHYSSKLYDENHKLLVKARVESTDEYRSSINWPDCFYNQIFGEYGILGVILFIVFYVWYFVKKIGYWSYGFWLSVMIIPFAFFSYLFEPFAVIIIYEFLMETDIKNGIEKTIKYNYE
jgi:hypothetical protein